MCNIHGSNSMSINNFLLREGEILIHDGRETASDLDTIQHCLTQSGKCITSTSIVLWNETETARVYDVHIIIGELQVVFTFKYNKTTDSRNRDFINPNTMDNNTVIDKINTINLYQDTNQVTSTYKGLLMMENTKEKGTDPENTKLQYLYNTLQEQFQQRFNEINQNSCRNRNNLLTLIEWILHDNPTVAII
ncbi:hypothetical protein LOAG_18705 [Loa loa]|uniref:Uncharacterized protein n=1 Tax=Loa loa TaxID=7209 RepID=A0A1S0UEW1_LOALO|nr:hypothetical protein LOAG_18705 [Loa loa]EJD73908.1 hypothetical protein LOAG_18705 [Loa loa]